MLRGIVALVFLFASGALPTATAEAISAQELDGCVSANIQARRGIQTVVRLVTDRVGVERTSRARM